VHRVQPTYRFVARAFFSKLLSTEVLSNVSDQKIFSLKQIIFVQIILACKNARKKPKSQMNFVMPTKFKKSQISGIWL
jgi:hypothetical protein